MSDNILVVEDDPLMLAALEILLLDEGYNVTTASSGIEAIEMARKQNFDLVVSDVQMAEMDGIETLSNLKKQQPTTRSIVITGYASPDVPIRAIKMGVDDYILKPFDDRQFIASVKRCLDMFKMQKAYTQGLEQQWKDFSTIVKLLAEGVEERDEHFTGHSRRVAELSVRAARKMGLPRPRLEILELAAFMHDIGSIGQKKAFLSKAEELVKEELTEVHAAAAEQSESLFSSVSSLREVFRVILHHHEWFDGTGYPHGLKGQAIPVESRVLCVAEAYDAMISPRPHRSPLTHADAREVLTKEAGTHFDPQIVEQILALLVEESDSEENDEFREEALSRERQAELMLGLSRTYLTAGDLETAGRGFSGVLGLVGDGAGSLNSEAHVGMALSLLHRARLEAAPASRKLAPRPTKPGSQLVAARARLTLGLVRAYQAENGLEDIQAAQEVLETWEAQFEIATAELYHAKVLKLQGKSPEELLRQFVDLVDEMGLHQILKQERYLAIPLLLEYAGGETEQPKAEKLLGWLGWEVVQPFLSDLDESVRGRALTRLAPRDAGTGVQAPPLSLYGFGKFRVFVGGQEVEDKLWKTRKSKYMFAFLTANAGKDVPDEKVMEIFWPDHEPEKARQSLYAALSHMRKALDAVSAGESERVVLARKGFYKFNADRSFFYDVSEFERLYEQGNARIKEGREDEGMVAFQKAEQLYQGEFMEGYYDDWAVFLREDLEMKYVELLQVLMEHFFDKRRYAVVTDYAQRLLKRDPCHQDAHTALMQAYIQQGKPELAARQYQTCTQVMKNELNMSPSPEMTELYLSITR
ncbi:unnamed protein product [Phaeothamnion confervicola]